MTRNFHLVCLALALLALTAESPEAAKAVAQNDTLAAPAKKDTIRAGDWTITGDVQKPGEDPVIDDAERRKLKGELQRMSTREVAGLRQWQRKKNTKVAMLSSALLPGLGQLYNGRRIKVGLAAGFFWTYFAGAWLNWREAQALTAKRDNLPEDTPSYIISDLDAWIDFYKESSRDFVWWTGAIWLICMLDAWIDAHLFDVRAYSPPAAGESAGMPPLAPQDSAGSTRYLTFTFEF
jgi:hypothetical protein